MTIGPTHHCTGKPFKSYRDLDGDLHFWHDYCKDGTGKVYLYSEKNPGERFKSIEFNVKTCGFRVGGAAGVTIDNFTVKCVGVHGISAGNCRNLTVRNCEFGRPGDGFGTVSETSGKTRTLRYGQPRDPHLRRESVPKSANGHGRVSPCAKGKLS